MTDTESNGGVGIAAIGTYVPSGVQTAAEMAEESGFPEHVFSETLGVLEKPVAAPGEHPSDMAIRASLDALERAGVGPEAVDIVIYAASALYDYGIWSPAAKVQHEIGAVRAFGFELRNGCNGGNLGMYLAAQHLLADPRLGCALVVCSDILSRGIDYSDEQAVGYVPGADGAAAAVLLKDHPDNRLLAYSGHTDGSLVDAVYYPLGGTRVPPTRENIDKGLDTMRIEDPVQLAYVFSELYAKNYVRVVEDVARKCARSVQDIRYLFTNQVRKKTLHAVFEALDLPLSKTRETIERYGHLSAADTLLGLSLALEEGDLDKGDLVVLACSSTGFHWAATALEH